MKKTDALKSLVAALVLVLGSASVLSAQETLPNPSVPLAAGVPASGQPSQVFVPAAAQGNVPASMPSAVPAAVPGMPGASGMLPGSPATSPNNLQGNVPQPQIVKDAVSGLQKTDPINLDDMIRAQDAINRLDLMLEIEKRQLELKKIQDEKSKPAMPSMNMGIPASALNLPAMSAISPQVSKPVRVKHDDEDDGESSSSSGSLDKLTLENVTGSNGRYTATIKDGDKEYTVRAGDSVGSKIKVRSVSLTSATLVKGKKSRTIKISSDAYIVRGRESAAQ